MEVPGKGFLNFIRERGVVGLAIGFMLGGAISKLVAAFVTDIVNPLIGGLMGVTELKDRGWEIGDAKILWGDFISVIIDFVVIAAVVYYGFKFLRLDKFDKPPEPPTPKK